MKLPFRNCLPVSHAKYIARIKIRYAVRKLCSRHFGWLIFHPLERDMQDIPDYQELLATLPAWGEAEMGET